MGPEAHSSGETGETQSSGRQFKAITRSIRITPTRTPTITLLLKIEMPIPNNEMGWWYVMLNSVCCLFQSALLPAEWQSAGQDGPYKWRPSVSHWQSVHVVAFVGGGILFMSVMKQQHWETAVACFGKCWYWYGGFFLSTRQRLKDRRQRA